MNRRPLAVTMIGMLYVAGGLLGLGYHVAERQGASHPFGADIASIVLVEVIAILAGVYMLRGKDWARWLAILWMAFHVAISVPHVQQFLLHSLLLVVLAYFLFYRRSAEYFRPLAR